MKIKKEAILVCSISSLSPQTKTKLIDKKKRKTNISNTINLPSITIVILKCSRFRTAQLITATSAGIGRTLSNAPVLSVTASSNQKHMMVRSTERTSLRLWIAIWITHSIRFSTTTTAVFSTLTLTLTATTTTTIMAAQQIKVVMITIV